MAKYPEKEGAPAEKGSNSKKSFWETICGLFSRIDSTGKENRIRVVIGALLICFFVGLTIIIFFGLGSVTGPAGYSVAGVGLLLAGGVFFLGGLLGFLFAIPHTTTVVVGAGKNDYPQYNPNTNLEQISDWLTKILVGVGLTELLTVPDLLKDFAVKIGPSLGGNSSGGVFAVAILMFFSIDGFLVGYLWTRKYYAKELQQSDIDILEAQKKAQRNQKNVDALNAAYQTLTPQLDQAPPTPEELDTAIASASDFTREAIYSIALNQRYRNFYGGADLMRTEPIFRSLIKVEPNNSKYHENLGYVLIRKLPPLWSEAETEFTAAIKLRFSQDELYVWYEGYRAVCRIHLDKDFNAEPRAPCSDPVLKKGITDDLDAARQQYEVMNDILTRYYRELHEWAILNGYSFDKSPVCTK